VLFKRVKKLKDNKVLIAGYATNEGCLILYDIEKDLQVMSLNGLDKVSELEIMQYTDPDDSN